MPLMNRREYRAISSSALSSSLSSKCKTTRVAETYCWQSYLERTLNAMVKKCSNDYECSDFVVPVHAFHQAPLAQLMKCVDQNLEVEVGLNDYLLGAESSFPSKSLYWFARIIKVAGYRLLLRFEGMDQTGDEIKDFWVHVASDTLQKVGFSSTNDDAILIPPESIIDRQSNWKEYVSHKICGFRTLPQNWNEFKERSIKRCKFKKGDRVELLDSLVSMRVRPALIGDIIGYRVLVKLSMCDIKGSSGYEKLNKEEDLQIDGIWMDQDSPLLFYVGWSLKVGYGLMANDAYVKHAAAVARALKRNLSKLPLAANDAHPDLFKLYSDRMQDGCNERFIEWEKGMKLEVLDPLDTWRELRVGTVVDLLEDGYLKVGFDGSDMVEDIVPLHCSSTLLFPAGYAYKYGVPLKHSGDDLFEWDSYLRETNSIAAPTELFENVDELEGADKFRIGAKLEAVDLCEPSLICPATVMARKGRLLLIKYDGWDDTYDQLFDFRSSDIYPLGWCEMYGHKLEAPRTQVKRKSKIRK